MTAPDEPDTASDATAPHLVAVVVRRTGGIAGVPRQWAAHPAPDDGRLTHLVARCPWHEVPPEEPSGADRFAWQVTVRWDTDDERHAALPDRAVLGPWRDLIEAVRNAGGSA